MDWIDTNSLISICTFAIGLTQFLFWRYIAKQKSYETEKGKNLVCSRWSWYCAGLPTGKMAA